MTQKSLQDLHDATLESLEILRRVDDAASETTGPVASFLEVRVNAEGEGIVIGGNQRGLVHLARLVLEVAAKGFAGAHQHLDDVGDLDACDLPLTIVLKHAE
jgi:hypothetical protein